MTIDRLPPAEKFGDFAVIRIPATPKSLNQLGQRGGWRPVHHEKKRWQGIIEKYLLMCKLPRPLPRFLRVSAVMQFPTKHIRDAGNFKGPLEKALGDALVNGGWLVDDNPQWWEFKEFDFGAVRGPNTTIITLDYGRID